MLLPLWYYFFLFFFFCVACYVLVILDNDLPGGEGGDEGGGCTEKKKQRHSRSKKTCACSFRIRIALSPKHDRWVISHLCSSHCGHLPNDVLPSVLTDTDCKEVSNLRKKHGLSMSSILSLFREQNKMPSWQLRSSSGMLYTDIPLKLALDCNLTLSSPTSVKTKRQSSSRNSKCATLPPKRSVAAFRHCACHY